MSLYWEAGVMMMTHHDLGGRRDEAEEGALKGRSEWNCGTRLDISIQKLHWQPGRTECSPIISIHQQSWKGEDRRKGTQEKKNGFDIQAGGLREVTSSRPFQKTWPPAVWWIMEPQMGHQGWNPGRNAWEPSLPGRRESSWRLHKWTPDGSDINSSNSFLSCPIWSNNAAARKWQDWCFWQHPYARHKGWLNIWVRIRKNILNDACKWMRLSWKGDYWRPHNSWQNRSFN